MRHLIVVFCLSMLGVPSWSADLTSRERSIIAAVNASVAKAGASYKAGNYDEAGQSILRAMKQIDVAVKVGSAELYDSLDPAMQRVAKAAHDAGIRGCFASSIPPPPEARTG